MRIQARWLVLILAVVLAGFAFTTPLNAQPIVSGPAPLLGADAPAAIPNRYIVVFKDAATSANITAIANTLRSQGGQLHFTYDRALKGLAMTLPAAALEGLRHNPNVAYIEQDQTVSLEDNVVPTSDRLNLNADQSGATWGLDRIDQRSLPLNGIYHYDYTGAGVNAYIIDTGIRITHQQFGGRAVSGYTAVSDGNGTNDCNGHGTHVSGTVGGSTYGVAKSVKLYAVRVLDCNGSGTNSGVIAGIDWVTSHAVKPAVANMSLGGGASSALDTAVSNSINSGVTYAIAGGNSNANACNYSPARVAAAITVGATTSTDARASYSNYGTCLDIFAPGSSITSAWNTSDTATNTISGTSMATPHVTGAAALYLQSNPSASPATVRNALVNNATSGKVTSAGTGSPNLLLYTLFGTTPPPSPTPIPPGPTPTRTATPPSGTNVVVNPGFENGTTGWTQYSSGGYQLIDTTRPHTGSYSAYECDYNNCTEYVEQTVTVPSNGTLTYWWYQTSSEGTSTAYDYLRVRLYSTGGTLLTTLRSWSNVNTRNTWSQDTLSLSAYAGQTLKLRFMSTTDSSLQSAFFIDDVSVK